MPELTLSDNGRISIRSKLLKRALTNWCNDKDRDLSDAARIALRQFLPKKYIAAARRQLAAMQNGKAAK